MFDYASSSPSQVESEREPGLFSDFLGICDWMHNTSLDIALTSPEAVESGNGEFGADSSKAGQDGNLSRIFGYLRDSAPFDCVIRRISAPVSRSQGKSLHQAFVELLRDPSRVTHNIKSPTMRLSVKWQLMDYLTATFDGSVPRADLICVNAEGGLCEASTSGEYMAEMWPRTGSRLLGILSNWIEMLFDRRDSHTFKEIGEQLAWLGCIAFNIALQHNEHSNGQYAKYGKRWRELFRNMCVAHGFPVSTRRGQKLGLELPSI
ncbi:hypothetical protein LTR95_011700 [Oleoguttula sp. CCFEE 5521]